MTPEETAEYLFNKIFDRNRDVGGHSLEITGIPGSGKTSLCLHFADITHARYSDEIIFWRDLTNSPVQFIRARKWKIFVERGCNFSVLDKNEKREIDLPHVVFDSIPHVTYNQKELEDPQVRKTNADNMAVQDSIFEGIMHRAEKGALNVIYFVSLWTWVDFIRYLRNIPEWVTVFWDEYEDIFPSASTGEEWWRIEWTKNNIKQIRKGFVTLFCNTQNKADVDWRIRTKMGEWAYLYGSLPDDESPIDKRIARRSVVGEGWLDVGRYNYGKFTFSPYRTVPEMWEVRI